MTLKQRLLSLVLCKLFFIFLLNFEGQKVLITGATGGIGQKTAELFAKQGAIVGLCGRNKEKFYCF